MKELPLRPNVCLLVANLEYKLFLGERNGNPGHWQFPQGGVEPEYSLEENVIKEAHEELGVDKSLLKIEKKLTATFDYNYRNTPEYAKGVWRGQSQTFWIVSFIGKDSDINLTLYDQEFMNFKWCTPQEVRQHAESHRRDSYLPALLECESWIKEKTSFKT